MFPMRQPILFGFAFRTIIFHFLYLAAGVDGDPAGCIQSWMPHGTTSASWTVNGTTVLTTTSNLTPMYAPCGTDWGTFRETITAFLPECHQTQTRDEPRLTSLSGGVQEPPTISCMVCSPIHSFVLLIY
jgi:hypothetical protein